jgi:uncharacterized membrane protein YdcZ (DUF606 family)
MRIVLMTLLAIIAITAALIAVLSVAAQMMSDAPADDSGFVIARRAAVVFAGCVAAFLFLWRESPRS